MICLRKNRIATYCGRLWEAGDRSSAFLREAFDCRECERRAVFTCGGNGRGCGGPLTVKITEDGAPWIQGDLFDRSVVVLICGDCGRESFCANYARFVDLAPALS